MRVVGIVGLALALLSGTAWAQEPVAPAGMDSLGPQPAPPAELSEKQLEVLTAAAGELLPLLPHEPGGQPGSAIGSLAILSMMVDSVGGRGDIRLSPEEGEAIVAGLTERGVTARFCRYECAGNFGDAAITFHIPRMDDDDATLWILSLWAVAQLPNSPPDRYVRRADELHLRRSDEGWQLAEHTVLRENVEEVIPSR